MNSDIFSLETEQTGMISRLKDATVLRELVENMQHMIRIMDDEHSVVYMNKQMRDQFKDLECKHCFEFFSRETKCSNCVADRAWESGESEEKSVNIGDKYFRLMSLPVTLTTGERFSVEIFDDITVQKRIELELMDRYEALTADLCIARSIQKGLLPKDGVYWNTIKLSSLYLPTDTLAGDIFDIVRINKDNFLLYIADVSGHGVHASLITIFVKEVVRGNINAAAEGLGSLIEALVKSYMGIDIDPELYFSLLLCKYNKQKKELKVANAGHNCYPLIVRKKGNVEEIKVKGLPISRLGNTMDYSETSVHFNRGDRLILYTDGITEEFNEEEQKAFGVEGVKAILINSNVIEGTELAHKIVNSASDYSTERFAKDDRAILVAEILS